MLESLNTGCSPAHTPTGERGEFKTQSNVGKGNLGVWLIEGWLGGYFSEEFEKMLFVAQVIVFSVTRSGCPYSSNKIETLVTPWFCS